LGILFVAGLIVSIKNIKNFYNQFFLSYFFLSLFPALMTYPWENPNMLRTFTVIPSVVYFIGVAIYNSCAAASKLYHKKIIIYYLLFIILLLSSAYELRTYFKYQSKVFESSFEIKHPLEKAIRLKNPYEKNK